MKRFYFSKLVVLIAILAGCNAGVYAQQTIFSYTGAPQTYTVSPGVTSVSISMQGASGGNSYGGYGSGGAGGLVTCNLAVTGGEVLNVYVGGAGISLNGSCCTAVAGGWNGGAISGTEDYPGSGGGASDIRVGGTALSNRVLVAGGGGGAGGASCSSGEAGGPGGGLTGGNGNYCSSNTNPSYDGYGGQQVSSSNGSTGCSSPASNGTLGVGGVPNTCAPYFAGGGGGGYWGGGGGYYYGGGGGGSSYVGGTGVSASTNVAGYNTGGNGTVTITGPSIFVTPASLSFPPTIPGAVSVPQVVQMSGVNLTSSPVTVNAPSGYQVWNSVSAIWTNSLTVTFTPPTLPATNVYFQFAPTFPISYCSQPAVFSGGTAPAFNLLLCGTGSAACNALPVGGTASASPASGGSGTVITLTDASAGAGGGVTYQWQMSTTDSTGSLSDPAYTNINGAVLPTVSYTAGIFQRTYFRCVVTCPATGSVASSYIAVGYNGTSGAAAPPVICNNPTASNTSSYQITELVPNSGNPMKLIGELGTQINDNTTSGSKFYYDMTATQSATLQMGNTYSMGNGGASAGYYPSVQVWIDFNGNGVFDPTESIGGWNQSCCSLPFINIPIPIPSTGINPGVYRMRIESAYNGNSGSATYPFYPNINPCSTPTQYSTETRDYTIVIITPPCSGTPNPGIAYADVANGCGNYNSDLFAIGLPNNYGISNNWQSSPTIGGTYVNIPGTTNQPIYTNSVTGPIFVRNNVTCASGGSAATAPIGLNFNTQPVAIVGGNTSFCSNVPTTLSDATPGGSWSSSNMAVASVSSGGLVTGTGGGTATISYTMPSGCAAFKTVTVYLAPQPITGAAAMCTGFTTTLGDITPGGVWSSSFPAFGSVNSTSGAVTGVSSGATTITYTIPAGGCLVTAPVTVNTQPAPITGTPTVCVNSTVTLVETSTGGTWSSSNGFQATVNATGAVTGAGAGNPVISYTLPGGCSAMVTATVNALPAIPVATLGTNNVCVGSTSPLTDGTPSGTWSSAFGTIATVAPTGIVTGVAAGTTNINYTITATGCVNSLPISVRSLPAVYNVTGGGGYCAGLPGADVDLSNSDLGITYYLYNTGNPTAITNLNGTNSGINFGPMPAAVTSYTVQAVDATYGCVSNMNGAVNVVQNPLPNVYTMGEGSLGFYCQYGTGVDLFLVGGSDTGVTYQVYNSSNVASGHFVSGTGIVGLTDTFDLGNQTAADPGYYVIATNKTTGCTQLQSGTESVSINLSPFISNVGGGGGYCSGGTGVHITLDTTMTGVDYRVYKSLVLDTTVSGNGSMLDFGTYTNTGTYTIVGYNITSGCTSNMNGSAVVSINPLPTQELLNGGGAYCQGGSGKHIGLVNSESGTTYALNVNGTPIGAPKPGSNSGLDFGADTTTGTYTVVATNGYGCVDTFISTKTIVANPLPNVYALSANGGYCQGTGGFDVNIPTSDVGTKYQLFNSGVPVGTAKNGLGGKLDFGNMPAGLYTIVATNSTTGCTANMSGATTIVVNPLPSPYIVSGGGAYCAGTGGKDILLSNSDTGITYNLLGGSLSSIAGTGTVIDFAGITAAGSYTIMASNNTTSCVKTMAGSATISVNPAPIAETVTVTNAGAICGAGGAGQHIGLATSTHGISYVLSNGVALDSVGGSGSSLDFGIFNAAGTYTIMGTNTATGCSGPMANPVALNVSPLPTVDTVGEVGTGTYCAGSGGVQLTLSGSDNTVKYHIYNKTTPAGVVTGSGVAGTFNLGAPQTATGTYTVVGVDTITGCSSNQWSSANVTMANLPFPYTVTGGGHRCSFGAGDTVGLSGSEFNTNYQVYSTLGGADGPGWSGTNLPVYLGLHINNDNYYVVATNPTTTCSDTMKGMVNITIDTTSVPAVNVATASDTVCSGVAAAFTAMPVNGGLSPVYLWKVNGIPAGAGATFSYIPTNGDIVSALLTSDAQCAFPASVSNAATMTVNTTETPSVSVASTTATQICAGTSVTFTATGTYPGSAPTYTWISNSKSVGTGTTYVGTFTDSAVVFCEMVSDYQCRTTSFLLSNNIPVTINEPVLPVFTISASPSTNLVTGQSVTLQAVVTNVTGGFTYQWYVNGLLQYGQTNPTFTYNSFNDMDIAKCVVTSVGLCGGIAATQNIEMHVRNTEGVIQVTNASDIRVVPNPNKGTFTVKGSLGTAVDEEVTLEVTNMLGQVVYNNKVTAQQGNIDQQIQLSSSLANGMYLLNVRSATDTKVFHFVIEQ